MRWLGTITGSSGVNSNVATGRSGLGTFTIPKGLSSLYLSSSASGIFFEIGVTGLATNPTRGCVLSPVNGVAAALGAQNIPIGPFNIPRTDSEVVVSIYNSAGGFLSVRVFGN